MIKKVLLLFIISITLSANMAYKSNFEKKVFLDLNPSFYTINLTTLYYYDGYEEFLKDLNSKDNIYVFEFGDSKEYLMTKVLFGVFNSYKEALKAVNKLPKRFRDNKPFINKIGKFQELFNKYHKEQKNTLVYPLAEKYEKLKLKLKNGDTSLDLAIRFDLHKELDFFTSMGDILYTHPEIQEKIYTLKSAKDDQNIQRAAFLPTVDILFDRDTLHNGYDSLEAPLTTKVRKKELTIKWNLFNGYQDYNQYKLKGHKYTSVIYDNQDFTNKFIFKYIKAYFEFAKVQEKATISMENLKHYKEFMKKIRLKEKYGMLTLSKSTAMFTKYVKSKINSVESVQKKYYDALYEMQKYININKKTQMTTSLEDIDIDISNYVLNKLLDVTNKMHPLILKSKSEIHLAQKELDKEYGLYMPKLDLIVTRTETDTYKDTGPDEIGKDTTVKFQAKMNLFNGSKDYYTVKQKKHELQKTKFKYQSTIREVSYGVKTSFIDYKLFEDKKLFLEQNVENAHKAYEVAKYDFEFAKIGDEGLIAAMEALKDIKLKSIDFKYDILVSKYKLLSEMGVLYAEIQERIEK